MKSLKAIYLILFISLFSFLVFGNIGCDPIEAISDSYSEVVDVVSPSDDKKDETVGSLHFSPNDTTTDNVANFNVIVLDQNGDRIKREVNVDCTFTNTETSTIVTQTSSVAIEGLATCVVINGDQNFVNVSAVATAEGVLSIPNTFNLPGTGFTAN